jgi:hypothetical protein
MWIESKAPTDLRHKLEEVVNALYLIKKPPQIPTVNLPVASDDPVDVSKDSQKMEPVCETVEPKSPQEGKHLIFLLIIEIFRYSG